MNRTESSKSMTELASKGASSGRGLFLFGVATNRQHVSFYLLLILDNIQGLFLYFCSCLTDKYIPRYK